MFCSKCGTSSRANTKFCHNCGEAIDAIHLSGQSPVANGNVFKYYYDAVFRKYAVFTGVSTRAEYWWFIIIDYILGLILNGISSSNIYYYLMIIPTMAIMIRRLRDVGRSSWWALPSVLLYIVMIAFYTKIFFQINDISLSNILPTDYAMQLLLSGQLSRIENIENNALAGIWHHIDSMKFFLLPMVIFGIMDIPRSIMMFHKSNNK